jgi:hypothetical protein
MLTVLIRIPVVVSFLLSLVVQVNFHSSSKYDSLGIVGLRDGAERGEDRRLVRCCFLDRGGRFMNTE